MGDVDKIRRIAEIVAHSFLQGHRPVVVVSAMAGFTDQLAQWARELNPHVVGTREYDTILTSGEQITSGLLASALQNLGFKSRSWLGWQLPILTKPYTEGSRIVSLEALPLLQDLDNGIIPVVAGFQGVNEDGHITTLGRGGSDITAAAVAVALKASCCQIFTDVNGVYTADPFVVTNARKFVSLSYANMLTLSSYGAKVLHEECVKLAMSHSIPIRILSTFETPSVGTWVGAIPDQKICGITQKNALQVYLNLSPSEQKNLKTKIIEASIPILNWHVDLNHNLSFLIWEIHRRSIEKLLIHLPHTLCPGGLITIINKNKGVVINLERKYVGSLCSSNIKIQKQFSSENLSNFMVNLQDIPQALNCLHTVLELRDVL